MCIRDSLYGTAYMKAGMAMAGKNEMDMEAFLAMMHAAVDGVSQRGKAQLEEATMLDAMIPSLKAMEEAACAGESTKAVLEAGVKAAWAGAAVSYTHLWGLDVSNYVLSEFLLT